MVEKNVTIPLNDSRLKLISEVLSNKSCLKILDLLAEKNLSVGDISKELNIPLNTIDYNVKKMVKTGLIEKESHWWSVKGKKIETFDGMNYGSSDSEFSDYDLSSDGKEMYGSDTDQQSISLNDPACFMKECNK